MYWISLSFRLNKIPLHVYATSSSFICWWTLRLLSYFGYCEQYCSGQQYFQDVRPCFQLVPFYIWKWNCQNAVSWEVKRGRNVMSARRRLAEGEGERERTQKSSSRTHVIVDRSRSALSSTVVIMPFEMWLVPLRNWVFKFLFSLN